MTNSLSALVARWREQAAAYEQDGQPGARLLHRVANELEATLREHELEALTLEQAEAESGYSYSRLQQLVADGTIPNAGDRHRPRIRRAHLPRKPGHSALQTEGEPDLAARVLAGRA